MARDRKGKLGGARKSLKPSYRGREQVPLFDVKYAEADGRYYGTGRAVFDILTAPVSCSVPWEPCRFDHHKGIPHSVRRELAMALKKVDQAVQQRQGGAVTVADAEELPLILEHLTAEAYPDGSKRQTSSLVVVSDGGSWRVCLSDKDNGRVMWKSGPTLQDAFQAIELALMADDPGDWRKSADASGKRRK